MRLLSRSCRCGRLGKVGRMLAVAQGHTTTGPTCDAGIGGGREVHVEALIRGGRSVDDVFSKASRRGAQSKKGSKCERSLMASADGP